MQSRAGGGDLRGGQDDARNAEIDKLRRLYLTSPTPPADTTLRRYGRYNDVPLARWGTVFLPHQQEALNIYEPQWVLLFEALLATPPPWLYAAAFLPGGSANLDNPAFALPERGARLGTLLQVVDAVRQPDSKLTLAVQAIGRCHVERVTQTLPYGRADVQLFPDAEQLLLASDVAGGAVALPAESLAARRRHERRRTLAAAAAEDDAWRDYEHAKPVLSSALRSRSSDLVRVSELPPPLSQFNASAARASLDAAEHLVAAALRDTPAPGDELDDPIDLCAASDCFDDECFDDEAAAPDTLETLEALEAEVWVEVDALCRSVGPRCAPRLLLGLLPPGREWPDDFLLQRRAADLEEASELASMGVFVGRAYSIEPGQPLVAADPEYPARRRAARLSFAVWAMVHDEEDAGDVEATVVPPPPPGSAPQLQRVLECRSTEERLRLAADHLRRLRQRVLDNDIDVRRLATRVRRH